MKIKVIIALLIVLIFQVFCLYFWIPFPSLITDTPVFNDDYPFHYSQINSVLNFFEKDGKRWGYSPYLMAGYPAPIIFGEDQMAWEIFVYLFSFLPFGVAFKLYIALFLIIFPYLFYFSASNFGLERKESFICLILGILSFYIPFFHDGKYPLIGGAALIFFGMVTYVFLCYLSIYVFSLLYRYLEKKDFSSIFLLFIFAPLLWLTHALAPVIMLVPVITILLAYRKTIKKKDITLFSILFLWIVMLNAHWIFPMINFIEYKSGTATDYWWAPDKIGFVYDFYIKQIFSGDVFYSIILLLGLSGIYLFYVNNKSKIAIPFFSQFLFLFLIVFFGGFSTTLSNFHPLRFIIPLHIFLIIPAGKTFNYISKKKKFSILFLLLFSISLYKPVKTFFLKNLVIERNYYLKTETPSRVVTLIDWIKKNTTTQGRIILEDAKTSMEHPYPYYLSHYASLLPIFTKREFLVSPFPTPKINPWMVHTFATFRDGNIFWRNIYSFKGRELLEYFNLYNVKWVICWSAGSVEYFNKKSSIFSFIKEIDGFYIFKVKTENSFFIKGKGKIFSTFNSLSLKNIEPLDNEIIIKYHWMKYLKTDPQCEIEKVMFLDDPVGFIKIKNPPKSLTVYNGY